ncbi:hypothetical protein E1258_05315 [Micromonospora sp. KC207]|uniref:PstS family phosphate ABC transporter substrate-binding protein n=1 Tax=Micromonospora sp. KC207 TaxID=2530377 RepID=UPI00104A567D|nr:substrate-binding domain-containing protein [Micromonospora sp. KC207]TDC65568.1 hypothetical protein E1258_05315 [Micromonospora sp. KC207]
MIGSIKEWAIWSLFGGDGEGDSSVLGVLIILLLTVSWQVWREIRARRAVRKRLTYHVTFNSRLGFDPPDAGEITRLLDRHGEPVADPSMVVIRISNSGTNDIASGDFQVPLRFEFGQRTVNTVDVTEGSPADLEEVFAPHLRANDHGVVLPSEHLNAGSRFKLLILLTGHSDDHTVRAGGVLKGGDIINAKDTEQKNRIRYWRAGTAVVASLCVGALAAVAIGLTDQEPENLDCVEGTVRAVGSSAFANAAAQAIGSYEALCAGSIFEPDFGSSQQGVEELRKAQEGPPRIAFSDGAVENLPPEQFVSMPLAVVQFSIVVNPSGLGSSVNTLGLSTTQIRSIFDGTPKNWSDIDPTLARIPITIVGRRSQSGSRVAFERYVLNNRGQGELTTPSCDKPGSIPGKITLCEVSTTEDVLDAVSQVRGAIGYASTPEARQARDQLVLATIDGKGAEADDPRNGYPFWSVEYIYYRRQQTTEPSLVTSFVDYLTRPAQADAMSRAGFPPCSELGSLCEGRA